MLYKFDILLKKELKSGGVKVVTYSNLLDNPDAFGDAEGFDGAEGELSMVLEGPEAGFSQRWLRRPPKRDFLSLITLRYIVRCGPKSISVLRPNMLTLSLRVITLRCLVGE